MLKKNDTLYYTHNIILYIIQCFWSLNISFVPFRWVDLLSPPRALLVISSSEVNQKNVWRVEGVFSDQSFSWWGETDLWWSCRICTHIPCVDTAPAEPRDSESVYERWPSGCPVSCILYRAETQMRQTILLFLLHLVVNQVKAIHVGLLISFTKSVPLYDHLEENISWFSCNSEKVNVLEMLFTWTSVDVEDIREEVWKQSLQKQKDILKFLQHPHQQIMFQNVLLRRLQRPHARLSGWSHIRCQTFHLITYSIIIMYCTCTEDAVHRNMGWCRIIWDWSILGNCPRCTC